MKHLPFLLLLVLFLPSGQAQEPQTLPPIEVYFLPKGGCTETVVKEIDAAKKTLLVQAYSFTSTTIAKALVDAHKRGVDVRVILDQSQRTEKDSSADLLQHAGIPVWIDAKHEIAHDKIMILDGKVVAIGTFDLATNADKHDIENLLLIRSAELATKYTAAWKAHLEHSEKYEGKKSQPAPVEVTLRPAKKPRFLEIEIKNMGTQPFSFLDIAEGCAWCDRLWEVEVRLASGKTLKPMMFYSPAGGPSKVSIGPGKTYVREIQPAAYVDFYHPRADEEGTIVVHYRVKNAHDAWKGVLAPPHPTFSTQPLKARLADFLR